MSIRKYTKDDYERVKELREKGMTFKEIGPLVGMSPDIAAWIARTGHRLPDRLDKKKAQVKRPKFKKEAVGDGYFKHDKYYSF